MNDALANYAAVSHGPNHQSAEGQRWRNKEMLDDLSLKDEKEMEEEEKQQQQQRRRSSSRNKFTHTLLKKSLPIDGAMSSRSGESVSRPVS